ncbi:MAG: murein biosynthesis integral membrane protein MurJ [Solirubrobacteraceae bacterium]
MAATGPPIPTAETLAGNSTAIAVWTIVSRLTGFVRIAVIAAVLGPTYFGSLFLAINFLPMLALQFLAGSLVGSLLIPSLTPSIDRRDREASDELAGGFLGAALVAFGAVALLAVLAAPVILAVLTIGVENRDAAADQLKAGWILMALTMPQLVLYAVALIGGAVMNAHGRFRLAAAAPVAENLGVMLTMIAAAVTFGTGKDIDAVSTGELLLLGAGSTVAVALHAGVMTWGARRSGVRMRPRRGWRIPAVRVLIRRLAASLGQSGLASGRFFAMLTVANTVPGGVVAFRLALNFLYLPVQVGAQPITMTVLPTLARLHNAGRAQEFREACARSVARICFLVAPATVGYLALSEPLAQASAFGAMAGSAGPALVAACLAGTALAVMGESGVQLFTNAFYARNDARSPFFAAVAGTAITLACLPVALRLDGSSALLVVGLALSAGTSFSTWLMWHRLHATLPPPQHGATRSVLRSLAASAVMAAPTYFVSTALADRLGGPVGALAGVIAGTLLGAGVFIAIQRLWRSPELAFFAGGVRGLTKRPADRPRIRISP